TFERHFLLLWVFGADGRVARVEQFDLEAEDRALARFDELAAEPRAARRQVRPNAATASEALLEAAVAGRDLDAIAAHLAEDLEVVDHWTQISYDGQGWLVTWRGVMRSPDGAYRSEPLASLGDSLTLCHYRVSGSGAAGKNFDVGAYDWESIVLAEV